MEIVDSDPPSSPKTTLRVTSTPTQPPLPLSALCCQAIEAAGGKATLSQIRRWIAAEHEWYRVNEGWQVRAAHLAQFTGLNIRFRHPYGKS